MKKTINKIDYDLRELTVGECLPIMEDKGNAGLEMVKIAVSVGGKPLGDEVLNLPYSTFNALMTEVNKIHGMSGGDEKGED